ncbi:sensor histidine kinase [Asaia prunellae]|uniref:sensor histidine kinase n=1 Tax=Asaia prunellae TaxID=610245 RepID=UPI00131ED867|nr:HWE histidine kinase domain-containing protein [Asaia prunellae]
MIGTLEDITRDRVATNRLSAMVVLGDALRRVTTSAEAYQAAAAALADALGVDRAGWALFELGDEKTFRIEQDWHGADLPDAAGIYQRADYRDALHVLEQGLLLSIRDARENIWLPCRKIDGDDLIRSQLLMPVLNQGRLTHCLYVQCCTPRDWTDQELAFMRAISDRAQAAAASLEARAHQQTMHQELAHRLKNTLALVQALANQSLRGVENREAVKAFEKRLVALGSAHDLLMRQAWQRGDLETLARDVLGRIAPLERFRLEGAAVSLGPNTATTLGLMLHELGTNAAKYGALSVEKGEVSLFWTIVTEDTRENLKLHWRETGGPAVIPPQSTGFGSRLLRAGFGHQGATEMHYLETGCEALFTIPLRQAQEN